MSRPVDRERLFELLADRADGSLATEQSVELARLLEHDAARTEARTVAAVELALLDLDALRAEERPLPTALRDRLLMAGGAASVMGGVASVMGAPASNMSGAASTGGTRMSPAAGRADARGGPVLARLGWLAAAAAVALAALAWWPGGVGGAGRGGQANIAALVRQADTAPDMVTWPFKGQVDEFKAAGGAVVWSDQLQKGYLRLTGLPANDPKVAQYQLWIVDPSRSKEPVDGGVFDVAVSPTGEVIVPIDAKLPIDTPAAFAITREKPGGVVVSAGPLLVVAVRG
jgi:hypothetical protein